MSWEAHKDGLILNSLEKAKWQCLLALSDVGSREVNPLLSEEVCESAAVVFHEGSGVCHQRLKI